MTIRFSLIARLLIPALLTACQISNTGISIKQIPEDSTAATSEITQAEEPDIIAPKEEEEKEEVKEPILSFHDQTQAGVKFASKFRSGYVYKKIISPTSPQSIAFNRYITLNLPRNAFLNQNGKPVKDSVRVVCTDYESMARAFLDGIPLHATEAGKKVQLQSGGMLGLSAFTKNGIPVKLDPSKGAEIIYWGSEEGPYDIYRLKNDSGSWENLTKKYPVRNPDCYQEKGIRINFDTVRQPENVLLNEIEWQIVHTGNPLYDIKNPDSMFAKGFRGLRLEKAIKAPRLIASHPAELSHRSGTFIELSDKQGVVFRNSADSTLHVHKPDGTEMAVLKESEYGSFHNLDKDQIRLFPNLKALFIESRSKVIVLSWEESSSKVIYASDSRGKYFVTSSSTLLSTHFSYTFIDTGNTLFKKHNRTITVINHDGKVIKELRYEGDIDPDFTTNDDVSEFMFEVEDQLVFIDASGNEASRYGRKDRFGKNKLHFTEQKNIFLYLDSLYTPHIWDRTKDKIYTSPDFNWKEYTESWHIRRIPESKPLLMVNADKKAVIWNWETQKMNLLDSVEGIPFFVMDGKYIGQFSFRGSSGFLINTQTMDTLSIGGFNNGMRSSDITFNKNYDRYILTGKGLGLYDKNNRMLKNLADIDPSIYKAEIESATNRFVTINHDEIIRIHDAGGNVLHKFGGNYMLYRTWLHGNWILSTTYDNKGQHYKVLDFEGNVAANLYNCNKVVVPAQGRNAVFAGKEKDTLYFLELQAINLPDSSYLVSFMDENDNIIASTYMQIKGCSYLKYLHYLDVKAELRRKEAERSAAYRSVRRSLAINTLGVYNWDIAYNLNNRLYCQLQTPFDTAYSHHTELRFLQVTGPSMNTLFEYYPGTLKEFSWNPDERNVLLTILPDNKIAVMHPHEFKRLQGSALKPGEVQQARFEIYDGEATSEVLDYLISKDK